MLSTQQMRVDYGYSARITVPNQVFYQPRSRSLNLFKACIGFWSNANIFDIKGVILIYNSRDGCQEIGLSVTAMQRAFKLVSAPENFPNQHWAHRLPEFYIRLQNVTRGAS